MNSANQRSCPNPALALSFEACAKLLRSVSDLSNTLTTRFERLYSDTATVRKSIAEAEALAWETSFPHLFLPALAEEKVRLSLAQQRGGALAANPRAAQLAHAA